MREGRGVGSALSPPLLVERLVSNHLACVREAMVQCKALIARVGRGPIEDAMIAATARRIARIHATDEGREGVAAFLERRKRGWVGG